MTEDIYCHENGLQHINLIDDEGFSALFVVNTPIFDNSGVAHGVEHMVFRRSTAFPQAETLFQLTSLTDAKINASTCANKTYFHCQSQCSYTFMLAIKYLLNGLFAPRFDAEDLRCEIYGGDNKGVIYQELIGIEQANNKESQSRQKSETNAFSYGGMSHLIGDLSLNDLLAFHQYYYQASNITLVTANANVEKIAHLIDLLPTQTEQSTRVKIAVAKHRKQSLSRGQSSGQSGGQSDVKSDASVSVQHNEDNEHQQQKYPPAINKLISVYYRWLHDPYYQEIQDYKEIASTKKRLTPHQETLPVDTQHYLVPALMDLSTQLVNDIETNTVYVNKPTKPSSLPTLFTQLCQQAKRMSQGYATDRHNALWLTHIETTDEVIANITSYIISAYPDFLAPRCQGFCYATQALTIEKSAYLAIYSAFDVSPDNRLKELPDCLVRLSQDEHFIGMSLALAKIKYCRAYQLDNIELNSQVNNNQVMQVTATDISTYLQSLASRA